MDKWKDKREIKKQLQSEIERGYYPEEQEYLKERERDIND